MDDGLLVTNLVYFGTLVIGGVMLVVVAFALLGTMFMAGVAQIGALLVRLGVKLGARLFVYRPEQTTTAPDRMEDHVRNAVVAKADAIIAEARTGQIRAAQVRAAQEASAEAPDDEAPDDAAPGAERSEEPPAAKPAKSEKPSLTLAYSDRTGPFTSPQPLVKAG
ncbi:hypothetical protein SPF06_13330 [Sinomonas sp. JGH33]|uniref:Uncharacterized protein n=1 Tax=Sinomonas terricola TaxID=3110330 RepID=A0ABU5T7T9_9MICC|nr:hypothetical protein [Sinomonas sp. JGH33]MEA5455710.1 hypothetical protein [Sinomonas sp. JGH33]